MFRNWKENKKFCEMKKNKHVNNGGNVIQIREKIDSAQ